MAVLRVRVLGSGHYRDEKFSFFFDFGLGVPPKLDIFVWSYLRFFDNFGILTVAAPRQLARSL